MKQKAIALTFVFLASACSSNPKLSIGSKGAVNSSNTNGVDGTNGLPGPMGPQGPMGPEGPRGPIGLTGSPGATGATGATGPRGADGPIGPAGVVANMACPAGHVMVGIQAGLAVCAKSSEWVATGLGQGLGGAGAPQNRTPDQICQAAGFNVASGSCRGTWANYQFHGSLYAQDGTTNNWQLSCDWWPGLWSPPQAILCLR